MAVDVSNGSRVDGALLLSALTPETDVESQAIRSMPFEDVPQRKGADCSAAFCIESPSSISSGRFRRSRRER